MAQITNVVISGDLNCNFHLKHVAQTLTNVTYDPKKFNGLIWNHKRINGMCLLFGTGTMICNGTRSWKDARQSLRQYARILQKLGYTIQLKSLKLITIDRKSVV